MARFDAYYFDLDYTLVDHKNSWPPLYLLRWLHGKGVQHPESILAPQVWNDRQKKLAALRISESKYHEWKVDLVRSEAEFKSESIAIGSTTLRKGAHQLLSSIDSPMALISNSYPESLEVVVTAFDLRKYFTFVHLRTCDDTDLTKPDRRIAEIACERLALRPGARVAAIGDDATDVLFAKNANLYSISVFNMVPGADQHFEDLEALQGFLQPLGAA